MQHRSINLVGVKATVFQKGQLIDACEVEYWSGYPAVVEGKVIEDPESWVTPGDFPPNDAARCRAKTEIVVFEITCIGSGYGDYRGALDYEIGSIGVGEVFGPYLVDMAQLAKAMLAKQAPHRHWHDQPDQTVNFVMAFSYSSGLDQFSGEWDADWEPIGVVDLHPDSRGPITSLAILPNDPLPTPEPAG
jgi:hypothetical protein